MTNERRVLPDPEAVTEGEEGLHRGPGHAGLAAVDEGHEALQLGEAHRAEKYHGLRVGGGGQ